MNKQNSLFFILGLILSNELYSDWIYFPYEYNTLLREKVSLELEYKEYQENGEREKQALLLEIEKHRTDRKEFEGLLDLEKRSREIDKSVFSDRIRDEVMKNRLLESKGSDKERSLSRDHREKEEKYRFEIDELRKKLEDSEKGGLQKLSDWKREKEKESALYKERIGNLESELSRLKNLTDTQKKELDRLGDQTKELEEKLNLEISLGQIRLKRFHNKLIINIDDKISFDSGSADLKPNFLPSIEKIRSVLSNYPENLVVVEGHTDNVPIKTRFRNNWHLSSERALAVLEVLLQNKEMIPKNFQAAGLGEHQPLVSNSTAENRALNRRVDIVVIPRNLNKEKQ